MALVPSPTTASSVMNPVVISAILMALSGALGWVVGKLGLANIKTDLANVKSEIIKVKNDLSQKTPVAIPTQTVVAPTVPVTSS